MQKIIAFIRSHPNWFLALLYFGIIWPLYVIINHLELNDHFKRHILKTKWDDMIPFEPIWVFAYAQHVCDRDPAFCVREGPSAVPPHVFFV
ncbi:MAG: hypothetical protein ACK57D_07585 [Sphingobacteriales bacterium]|jgi:hypothetical protein